MKIAFDARTVRKKMTGVGVYTRSLLQGLMNVDQQNEYYCYFLEQSAWDQFTAPNNFKPVFSKVDYQSHPSGEWWEHFTFPKELEELNIELVHGPAFSIPWRGNFKKVVTIHDLAYLRFPETVPFKFRQYLKWMIRNSVRKADGIISVSYSTKNDIVDLLSTDPNKIHVVHEAAGSRFNKIDSPQASKFLQQKNLPENYVLAVGTIEPRKGLDFLIDAWQKLDTDLKEKHPLLLVGGYGWKSEALRQKIGTAISQQNVFHIEYAEADELPYYYSAAAVLAYPSLYEGFGLPPLEAMACGTPVVSTKISSMQEVIGNAGILCQPQDTESLNQSLNKVLTDKEFSDVLTEKGLSRSKEFSWDRAAQETMQVYQSVFQ